MFRQQFSRRGDPVDNSLCEFRLAKVAAHRLRQFAPKRIPAFHVNTFIADHRKRMRPRRHKNKDSIPFGRFVHSQP